MPIIYIDYSNNSSVGDFIEMFRNETGLSVYVFRDHEITDKSITISCLQRRHFLDMPLAVALSAYRGSCIVNIENTIEEIERLIFERYLLNVKIYTGEGIVPFSQTYLKNLIVKEHSSKYRTEKDISMLRERSERIYIEALQKVNEVSVCLDSLKAVKKESDSLAIQVSVIYRFYDMNDEMKPDDVYTQYILFDLDGKTLSDKPTGCPEPSSFFFHELLSSGLTVYDILRLNYRIIISIDWGSCRKNQTDGYGIEY